MKRRSVCVQKSSGYDRRPHCCYDRLLIQHLWGNQRLLRSSNLTKLIHSVRFLKVPNLKIVLFNFVRLRRRRETFLSESWTLSSEWLWSFAVLLIKAKLNFVDQKRTAWANVSESLTDGREKTVSLLCCYMVFQQIDKKSNSIKHINAVRES